MTHVQTEPSLALVKYWGKAETGLNIPATGSIAVSLSGLNTSTDIRLIQDSKQDRMILNGEVRNDPKINSFLDYFRQRYPQAKKLVFEINSSNNFPTSAGIASSSSGFAALAIGLARASGLQLDNSELSRLARCGSGSASRAVFGGFTSFPAGAEAASQLFGHEHWPDLQIIVVMVHTGSKPVGSRDAMELTRKTSDYYQAWIELSADLQISAEQAVAERDLSKLGPIMRRSYMAMFGSMFAADPPVLYWLPDSVALIHQAAEWRRKGLEIWETMDAGPQVKLICTRKELPRIEADLKTLFPHLNYFCASVGSGPIVRQEDY
ncbi:diphosphomevalonate decarboxylase [Spirochaeta dissipatitropha]